MTVRLVLGGLVVVVLSASGVAQTGTRGEWRSYSGDPGSTKYAPLAQIDKTNVSRLRIAWRRPAVDPSISAKVPDFSFSHEFRATPLMVGGMLYSPNGIGLVEAFHAGTGKTLWVQQPFPGDPSNGLTGDSTRGVAYWADASLQRLFVVRGEYLIALNPKTGQAAADFGLNGRVHLRPGLGPLATNYSWTGAPQVCRDVVIVGATMTDRPQRMEQPPGNVQAFDVRTGRPRWAFRPIPRPGEVGSETWEKDSWSYSGQANLWSLISADEELGLAYLPLGSATNDMYGGHRLGDNLFSSTLVCVRCATGERVWHFQTTHHDLWDYDLPAAPILADIRVGGRPIKAVIQLTKQALAFVFDRATGAPVWPIEERRVPQSETPGERTSPTQPFPTKPLPFDRQGVTRDDLIDFTAELRAEAVTLAAQYRLGPVYTPPTLRGSGPGAVKGTLELPGSVGGGDWQGGAFDPETGRLYVQSITGPFVADLVKGDPARTNLAYGPGTREYAPGPQGLPLLKPPYGRITAIDLNTGDHVWMVPHGDGPRDHPALKAMNLPPLGNPGRAAPVLTRTLLFIGGGDPIMVREQRIPPGMPVGIVPGAGDRTFRAYDKGTGEQLWSTTMAAGTTGAPMTYMFEGKQYVVVAIGSDDHPAEYVAFSLP